MGATDQDCSQAAGGVVVVVGSEGQRACPGSVQVFPMFLMREAVPAPPPGWDRVCTCRLSPGLAALSLWGGGLRHDPNPSASGNLKAEITSSLQLKAINYIKSLKKRPLA